MAQETQASLANQQQIQIKISDQDSKGVYANMALISHTQPEFVLDFMNIFFAQQPPQGIVTSRVIVNPSNMKAFVSAMQENIRLYEEKFGKIAENKQNDQGNFGFRTE